MNLMKVARLPTFKLAHSCSLQLLFYNLEIIQVENTTNFWAKESNSEIPIQKIDQQVCEPHYD